MDQAQFQQDLQRCKELMLSHQFSDALELAVNLLEEDHENLLLHLIVATIYARSDKLMEALAHYMLLAQFDPSFELEHCKELARGYRLKGMTDAAAMLAHAGAVKLESKELYQLAIDYYAESGNTEQAEQLKEEL